MTPRKYEMQLPEEVEREPIGSGRFIATRATSDAMLVKEWCAGYDGHSRRAYERIGARLLDELDGPLRQAAIEDYRAAVSRMGVKPDGAEASRATRATYTAAVKSFLGFAHGVGYLAFNPAPFVKIEKQRRDLAKRIISDTDVRLLIRAAKPGRNRLLIEVGYYGGLRVFELIHLRWSDILERDGGRIQITSLEGKGGKVREVLLPPGVSERLRLFRGDALAGAPLFVAARHGGAISERYALEIVKGAARDAGLTDKISPHWLRHAHISHALDNGAPVSLVSQSVGHADMKTTSIYAHARPGDSSGLYLKDL